MANYNLLDLSNESLWQEYIGILSEDNNDVYYTPEYYKICEKHGYGKAKCFVFEQNHQMALYPFMMDCINNAGYKLGNDYFDIQGAYGYNGILSNITSPELMGVFYKTFDIFCRDHNIVAEFLRINPLTTNFLKFRANFQLEYIGENINVDLTGEDFLYDSYEYSTRKNIKKAISSGLNFYIKDGNDINNEELEAFYSIYQHTMIRNKADEFYYFKIDFFRRIAKGLQKNAIFLFVTKNDIIISCELVLLGGASVYSYLGGTLSDYYPFRPNDYLKHKAIEYFKLQGFKNYLLGGGGEGVLRYKRSFAKNGIVPFYIGRKIHNIKVYEELVNQWENKYPEKREKFKDRLLKYRF